MLAPPQFNKKTANPHKIIALNAARPQIYERQKHYFGKQKIRPIQRKIIDYLKTSKRSATKESTENLCSAVLDQGDKENQQICSNTMLPNPIEKPQKHSTAKLFIDKHKKIKKAQKYINDQPLLWKKFQEKLYLDDSLFPCSLSLPFVPQRIDNDVQTDEQQIQTGVRKLERMLRQGIEKEAIEEQQRKNPAQNWFQEDNVEQISDQIEEKGFNMFGYCEPSISEVDGINDFIYDGIDL